MAELPPALLAPMDHGGRIAALRAATAELGIDGFLVTNPMNIRWLSGFTGSNGWILLTSAELTLFTDGRYGDQSRDQLGAAGVDATFAISSTRAIMTNDLAGAVARAHIGRLGFEGPHITYADHRTLSSTVSGEWTPTAGLVEQLRRTKDQGEIDRMERACDIADAALATTTPLLFTGTTEAQFRDALENSMREHGGDGPSFDTIVAAGANAALPHHHPDDTRIVEGMTVVIDFGAMYDGYHSDMTRTLTIGDPSPIQAEVYEVVLAAQVSGVAAVASGARGQALDQICRDSIAAAGWGQWFTHGTGHGVGLQIHESPWLTQSYDDTLAPMDVVTVEPGVYRRDFGGVRIEDMVVVTTNGCRPLTKTPKDSPCPQSPPTI
ncbi:MAG: Xaa-Pro peptidase family protein [Ilumatobacteraceae bacterium]